MYIMSRISEKYNMALMVPLEGTELQPYYNTKNMKLSWLGVMLIVVTQMGQYFKKLNGDNRL